MTEEERADYLKTKRNPPLDEMTKKRMERTPRYLRLGYFSDEIDWPLINYGKQTRYLDPTSAGFQHFRLGERLRRKYGKYKSHVREVGDL